MPQIVISYRREDSGVITGRIFDRLVARYGYEAIFRDIDNIPIGVDFRTHIDQVLGASDIVLAVVGPRWAGPPALPSRLGNEADPVRVEIETALRKGASLIPVLVLGGAMPTASQLPESLKDFAYRNAVQLDAGQDFDVHMARLIRAIDGILGLTVEAARAFGGETAAVRTPSEPPKRPRVLIGASIAAVLVIAVAAGWYFVLDPRKSPLPADTAAVAPNVAPVPPISPPSTPSASSITASAPSSIDPELLFWQTIASRSTQADFEEYLRKYPQGQFAGLARNRLVALLPAPEQPMPRAAPAAKETAAPATQQPAAQPAAKAEANVAPKPAAIAPPQSKQAALAPAASAPVGKATPVQIQLGSFPSPEAAREDWARLKRDNPDLLGNLGAVAVRTDLGDKGIYYRVLAGSFGDAAAAEKLCSELKRRQLGCILAR